MNLGLEIRTEILTTSLIVENMTSVFLSSLLGIKDYKNSNTLGNKSGCLSFNQKIDLLIEIGALSKDNKKKFKAFMEIRNQFIHNYDASNYENCIAFIDGKDKYLLREYPQKSNLKREEQLRRAVKQLGNDVAQLITDVTEKIREKIKIETEASIIEKSNKAFINSIEEVKTQLDNIFDEEIEKSPTYNTQRLKNFGTQLSKIIMKLWAKNFDKLNTN